MGQEDVEAARQFAESLDNLNDRVLGLQVSVGTKLIPTLDEFIKTATDPRLQVDWLFNVKAAEQLALHIKVMGDGAKAIELMDRRAQAWNTTTDQAARGMGTANQAILEMAEAAEVQARKVGRAGDILQNHQQQVREAAAAVAAAEQAYVSFQVALDGEIGRAIDEFNTRQLELKGRAGEIQTKIDELNTKTYLTEAQQGELTTLKTDLGEIWGELDENAKKHEEWAARTTLAFVQQQLALDGVSKEDAILLNQIAEDMGLLDHRTRVAFDGIVNSVALAAETGNWELVRSQAQRTKESLDGIPNYIPITIDIITQGTIPTVSGGGTGAQNPDIRQHGGPVWPGGEFLVGERGPEIFRPSQSGQIVPNERLGEMGGINFYAPIYINSGMDEAAFEAMLLRVTR
jgi:hypothetical protein